MTFPKFKDHQAALCVGTFLIAVFLFCVCTAFPRQTPVEDGWTCVVVLFAIPLFVQSLGLIVLYRKIMRYHRHQDGASTPGSQGLSGNAEDARQVDERKAEEDCFDLFCFLYFLTMSICNFSHSVLWLEYLGESKDEGLSYFAMASVVALVLIIVVITSAILGSRDGVFDDSGSQPLRELSYSLRKLKWGVEQQPFLALLLFFTSFLVVSYLFGFAFAFHDRSETARHLQAAENAKKNRGGGRTGSTAGPQKGGQHQLGALHKRFAFVSSVTQDGEEPRGAHSTDGKTKETGAGNTNHAIAPVTPVARSTDRRAKETGDGDTNQAGAPVAPVEDQYPYVFEFEDGRAILALNETPEKFPENPLKQSLADQRTNNFDKLKSIVTEIENATEGTKHVRVTLIGRADSRPTGRGTNESMGTFQSNYELAEARARNVQHNILEKLDAAGLRNSGNLEWFCLSQSNERLNESQKKGVSVRSKAKLAEAVSDRRVIARVEPINDDLVAALMQHGKADAPGELSLIDYVYFANYTITTTGYGDIVPVTAYAKFLCSAANICEVFFLVVFFNTLLSLRQPAGRKPPEDRQTGKQRAANAAKEDSTDEQDAARFGVGASIKAANASAQESATPPADSAPSVPAKAEDQFKETRRPRTTRKLRAKRNDERSGPAPP